MIEKPNKGIRIPDPIALSNSKINYQITITNIFRLLVVLMLISPSVLSARESSHFNRSIGTDTIKQTVPFFEQITKQSAPIRSLEEYVRLNQLPQGEKIFLHPDLPNNLAGDTIWFKAYSWFGYDQKPKQ
jgi:hypothetical protein